MEKNFSLSFLNSGTIKLKGLVHDYVGFIENFQLKCNEQWQKFTHVFKIYEDIKDDGWRGEYWGKMMRGACLVYYYSQDQELYAVLEKTVIDLLSKQDELGRISSYNLEREFNGWDMWSRKYVITGLLHFVDICKEDGLKAEIINVLRKHIDYIIEKIGDKEGQRKIELTSTSWGGVNSCTILEPVLDFYKRTQEKKYLDFAEYIIHTGGSSLGDLIKSAYENKLMPCEYPVQKAYEVMSFFEGLLAYYELTGDEYYLKAVNNFVEAVQKTEITVIGCAGMLGECFNNAVAKQTEIVEHPTQETCVTVTWMRLLTRLLKLTGWLEYANRIEIAGLNAFFGSINVNECVCNAKLNDIMVEGLPFDSYSPLNNSSRNKGVGGFKDLQEGGYYGCCACIGSAGVAIIPLTTVMKSNDGYLINYYHELEVDDGDFAFSISGNYLNDKQVVLTVEKSSCEPKEITFKVPSWCDGFEIKTKQQDIICDNTTTSRSIKKIWKKGEQVIIKFAFDITLSEMDGFKIFRYGPLVLARDDEKDLGITDVSKVGFDLNMENLIIEKATCEKGEMARFLVKDKNGKGSFILSDYASCGKHWDKDNQISVWLCK